jgi:hypothetical protein
MRFSWLTGPSSILLCCFENDGFDAGQVQHDMVQVCSEVLGTVVTNLAGEITLTLGGLSMN